MPRAANVKGSLRNCAQMQASLSSEFSLACGPSGSLRRQRIRTFRNWYRATRRTRTTGSLRRIASSNGGSWSPGRATNIGCRWFPEGTSAAGLGDVGFSCRCMSASSEGIDLRIRRCGCYTGSHGGPAIGRRSSIGSNGVLHASASGSDRRSRIQWPSGLWTRSAGKKSWWTSKGLRVLPTEPATST